MEDEVEVTLDPGETYHYHYQGGYIPPSVPAEVCYALVTDNTAEPTGRPDMPVIGDRSSVCSFYAGSG
ncbi:hypothetical protein ES703_76809 [subsurface metagenome]